jgi:hypothetical protein
VVSGDGGGFKRLGVSAILFGARIVSLRTRPWADVWRVDADDGRWWLKVNEATV